MLDLIVLKATHVVVLVTACAFVLSCSPPTRRIPPPPTTASRSALAPSRSGPTPHPSPAAVDVSKAVTCADAFQREPGSSPAPAAGLKIHSEAWKGTAANLRVAPIVSTNRGLYRLWKTPVSAGAGAGTVAIAAPGDALLFITGRRQWMDIGGKRVVGAARILEIPGCATASTFPGAVLVTRPTCVTISAQELHGGRPRRIVFPAFTSAPCS